MPGVGQSLIDHEIERVGIAGLARRGADLVTEHHAQADDKGRGDDLFIELATLGFQAQ